MVKAPHAEVGAVMEMAGWVMAVEGWVMMAVGWVTVEIVSVEGVL